MEDSQAGEDQWTTIDRRATKKKSKQEEKAVIVDEGWEQVGKKEKRNKKDSVSNGQKNDKPRNGDRYGGGRGGRGADGGSNKGTLPRKNSSKPPRGESGRGRGGGGRGTQSPAPAGRGSSRGVTPQPAPTPAPVNKNTWAAKISAPAGETVSPAIAQPQQKFSWGSVTAEPPVTPSTEKSEPGIPDETDQSQESADQPSSKTVNTETVKSQPTIENIPATETRKIHTETVEKTETVAQPSVELSDKVDRNVDKEESLEENNDNKSNSTVITGPDSNGNFEADDNNFNNNSDKTCNHGLKEDKVAKPPLINGDLEPEPEVSPVEVPSYKDDQWSPANMEGKKQYDRDFLISLQANPLSLQKPETLPSNMDVILNSPNPDTMRNITSAPNLNNMFERTPFVRASNSHKGTPRNHSRRKEPRQGSGMVITLPSQEVKLNEAGENAWKPSKKDPAAVDDIEGLTKKIRAILNKLCPQKFDTLVARFNELVIDTEEKLVKAMELVFEKALDEPVFSVAYARMCQNLQSRKVQNQAGEYQDFRTLLLKRCQEEFLKDYMDDLDRKQYIENLDKAESEDEKKNITLEFEAQEMKLRRRSLGNIRFIGELYKIKMLNGKIMHECIRKLLCHTDEESLECLCRLVTTIGQLLEQETKSKQDQGNNSYNFDEYFNKMQELVAEKKISARVRFLMQDVIDLRQANWIKRREDAGPKTIDQIHKEAQKEEMKQKLANMTDPPPSRKSEDRSSQRRSMIGRRENSRQEDWNNIPTRPAKLSEKPDISKLNISRVDPNVMSFGPAKNTWTRGSYSSGKKTSMQEPLLKVGNKFAGLLDEEGEAAVMPPVYHGRASEPAISKNRERGYRGGGRSRDSSLRSRDGSYSGPNSREGSYSGRTSREAGPIIETRDVIAEGSNNILKGDKTIDREKLEMKTKNLLDEYLNNLDLVEAFTCVTELFHVTTIHLLVEIVFNNVVERKEKDRVSAGRLFSHLLKNESLPRAEFLKGVEAVLEFAEDLLIDIPQFWEYFGVMIATILVENSLDVKFIQQSSSVLKSRNLDGAYSTAILHQMSRMNQTATAEIWHKAGIKLSDLNINGSDDRFDFLAKPIVNGVEDVVDDELDDAISRKDVNTIFTVVDNKYPTVTKEVLRGLTLKVMMACIDGQEGSYVINEDRLRNFGVNVLKKYLDGVDEKEKISKELEALFSFQSLVFKLEHPNKLLHNVFDVVYDCDLISEDAFLEWEENTDPEEQDGKGVALKSCTQFFQWLKTAEPEDDEDEKQKTVPGGETKEEQGLTREEVLEQEKLRKEALLQYNIEKQVNDEEEEDDDDDYTFGPKPKTEESQDPMLKLQKMADKQLSEAKALAEDKCSLQ